ncbi:hypothetical protein H8356DRAFT_1328923 [Neocallimastix lanati (nom. inval.)]|nr:hypothetical protein H8356DRAFT_1328923 [Neocallimastix sp. JGI-2020a]
MGINEKRGQKYQTLIGFFAILLRYTNAFTDQVGWIECSKNSIKSKSFKKKNQKPYSVNLYSKIVDLIITKVIIGCIKKKKRIPRCYICHKLGRIANICKYENKNRNKKINIMKTSITKRTIIANSVLVNNKLRY